MKLLDGGHTRIPAIAINRLKYPPTHRTHPLPLAPSHLVQAHRSLADKVVEGLAPFRVPAHRLHRRRQALALEHAPSAAVQDAERNPHQHGGPAAAVPHEEIPDASDHRLGGHRPGVDADEPSGESIEHRTACSVLQAKRGVSCECVDEAWVPYFRGWVTAPLHSAGSEREMRFQCMAEGWKTLSPHKINQSLQMSSSSSFAVSNEDGRSNTFRSSAGRDPSASRVHTHARHRHINIRVENRRTAQIATEDGLVSALMILMRDAFKKKMVCFGCPKNEFTPAARSPWCEDDQLEVHHPQVVHNVRAVPRKKLFHQVGVLQERRKTTQVSPEKKFTS